MTNASLKPLDRPSNKSKEQLSSFGELADKFTTKREVQPQPAPLVFNGEVNKYYQSKRNGLVKTVYLVEVKKDKAIVKDKETDKHSRNMSLAEFIKFYA